MIRPFARGRRSTVLALALVASACGGASDDAAQSDEDPTTTTPAPTTTPASDENFEEPVTTNEPVPETSPDAESEAEQADSERSCTRLTDFETPAEIDAWLVVNDDVMGGRSDGGATFADSVMTFTGTINTDGGGFASLRLPIDEGTLADVEVVRMRVRSDGRSYKLTMRDSLEGRDNRTSHQAPIPMSTPGEWSVVDVSLSDLTANVFGRSVETDPFVPELGNRIGLMMSDGVDGDFELDLDWIDLCGPTNQ